MKPEGNFTLILTDFFSTHKHLDCVPYYCSDKNNYGSVKGKKSKGISQILEF